jgi:hypothetical protein
MRRVQQVAFPYRGDGAIATGDPYMAGKGKERVAGQTMAAQIVCLAFVAFFQWGLMYGLNQGGKPAYLTAGGTYDQRMWMISAAINGVLCCICWIQFDFVAQLHRLVPRIVMLVVLLAVDGLRFNVTNEADMGSGYLSWEWPGVRLGAFTLLVYAPTILSFIVYKLRFLHKSWKVVSCCLAFLVLWWLCYVSIGSWHPAVDHPDQPSWDWGAMAAHLHPVIDGIRTFFNAWGSA